MDKKKHASQEQLTYARLLDMGMKIGLVALAITYALYLTGLVSPHIPVTDLPKYWGMPVHDYLKATDIHAGWSWLGMLHRGDFLNFTGIVFLSAITILCYLAIIPSLIRKKDTILATIAVIEVLVLVLAASGILKGGGH